MANLLEEQRENWGSRTGFVLAAIGSAVGLGNLWGFPYKLYSYGGGAFLIPYVIAMLLIGIPLLIAEFSLGHMTQRATPDAYGRIKRPYSFVGWWQIIFSFIIITYYAVILAYCLSFFYYSIVGIVKGSLPWAGTGLEGVRKAKAFFFENYLHSTEGFALGRMQWHIVISLVITWMAMYLCIFRGVRLVGKVVMWTVPLPWLMLLILTIRGLTLDGAIQGLEYYLEPNWSRLADPVTWRWAFGQMFFSMSLAFGIMMTYASFLHRKSDLNNNAAITGLADTGTSFVAGLAVFATLGGMAYASTAAGAAVPVDAVAEKGPSLAFVAFPYALAQLPHATWFSLVFFASLLLLGIDSAFSITESVLASIVDKTGWSRDKTLIGLTLVGLIIGLLFCTQSGLNWLDSFDTFINGTWGITLTALLECFVLGWLFRLRRLRDHANERSDWRVGRWWDWAIRVAIPIILAGVFSWSLFDALANPNGYAYKYEPEKVAIAIPVAEKLPDRAILEARFVADFSGETEHTFTLDETQAGKTAEAWTVHAGGQPTTLPEGFKFADLGGKELSLTTDKVTPRTAYTVQYRWNFRPETDAKTGLPVKVPEAQQPRWTELTRLTTTSHKAGINTGNAAGLCLMAIAPILAIVIAAVRIRRHEPAPLAGHDADQGPGRGTAGGVAAVVLGLLALGLMGWALMEMLVGSEAVRLGQGLADEVSYTIQMSLIGAGVAGLVSLLLGGGRILRCERAGQRPSPAARLGAMLGVLDMGLCGGLALAFTMTAVRFGVKPTRYDGELSGQAYLVLGLMLGLIVVGLLWCFYRAIKAAGAAAEEKQPPEAAEAD